MLPPNFSSNLYHTTRTNAFFNGRKRLMVEENTKGNGGKSFNPSWNANKNPAPKVKSKRNTSHTLFMITAPWSIYISVILTNLLWITQ